MVKMVSLSNKAYEELKKIKNQDESFSDVILKLLENKNDIKKFAGLLKSEKETLESIEKSISNDRKINTGRYQ